jgi:DNA repair exonuclease SbcCD ATPase subunit
MAEIKMDVSEYEIMKDNKRLLEKALEREQQLSAEIERLNKEKIEALENAKMKVIKISRSERTDYMYMTHYSEDALKELYITLRHSNYSSYPEFILRAPSLLNTIFKKETTTHVLNNEITYHGLDDVRAEIRNDIQSQIDEDTKTKLKEADELINKYAKLMKEVDSLRTSESMYKEGNRKLTDKCDEYLSKINEIDAIMQKDKTIITDIKDVLKDGYGYWGKAMLLEKIMLLIRD